MKKNICICILASMICLCAIAVNAEQAEFVFQSYEEMASNNMDIRHLPGCDHFVFTIYGTPGNLDSLKKLVSVMQKEKMGNGCDPGPAARANSKPLFDYLAQVGWPVICYPGYADMPVMGGRCILDKNDIQSLSALDQKGLFTAIQLGEWGYYFHNLSTNQSWFRDVYGKDFERYKHLVKPADLKGYDEKPTTRRECYETLKAYYLSRHQDMGKRSMSVTGHSHYEAYAAEWGSPLIGLELGENIGFTQSKIAFARGAARQWQRPWSIQVSPWFHGSCTTNGPLRMEGQYARGLDAGHSLNFYWRIWLHAWFSGTALLTPENSISTFFENTDDWTLTSHGKKAADFFHFVQSHERGIPYAPVAIVIDHLAGYNAYQGRPWGILEPTQGDIEIEDLFQEQLFPGSDHIHDKPDVNNPEISYLRPTPFGEFFDVLLSSTGDDILASYPIILLTGDIDFSLEFLGHIKSALQNGSQVLISQRHAKALKDELAILKQSGAVEILETWSNPKTGRSSAISNTKLESLIQKYSPIKIEGDPVQYRINRTSNSWIVELINNNGVIKRPASPVTIDKRSTIHITLTPRFPVKNILQWESDKEIELNSSKILTLKIEPGEVVFLEFIEAD